MHKNLQNEIFFYDLTIIFLFNRPSKGEEVIQFVCMYTGCLKKVETLFNSLPIRAKRAM